MPTFFDMTGFEDDDSDTSLALLELVFTGRMKDFESLTRAKNYAFAYGAEALLKRYNRGVCNHPIDRIIVVCSSNPDGPLPTILLNAVRRASTRHRGNYDMLLTSSEMHLTYYMYVVLSSF